MTERELWCSPDALATSLVALFINRYGVQPLSGESAWLPESIRWQVEQDLNISLPQENFDKLMTAILLLTTNFFYTDVQKFVSACNILSGDSFDPESFDPASVLEMEWGLREAMLLDPPENPSGAFSAEVIAYMRTTLEWEGFILAPTILRAIVGDLTQGSLLAFDEDPEMYAAMYQSQQTKTEEVNQIVAEEQNRLREQLRSLPIKQWTHSLSQGGESNTRRGLFSED